MLPAAVRVTFVVPAYQAAQSITKVVTELCEVATKLAQTTTPSVLVVDDGSTDETGKRAAEAGALVVLHPQNRGKGRALVTGFERALALGAEAVVSVDADGQHPASEALLLAEHEAPREALVLGVRDLLREDRKSVVEGKSVYVLV